MAINTDLMIEMYGKQLAEYARQNPERPYRFKNRRSVLQSNIEVVEVSMCGEFWEIHLRNSDYVLLTPISTTMSFVTNKHNEQLVVLC